MAEKKEDTGVELVRQAEGILACTMVLLLNPLTEESYAASHLEMAIENLDAAKKLLKDTMRRRLAFIRKNSV